MKNIKSLKHKLTQQHIGFQYDVQSQQIIIIRHGVQLLAHQSDRGKWICFAGSQAISIQQFCSYCGLKQ